MGGDPNSPSPELLPTASFVDGHLTLTYRRDLAAGGVVSEIETSGDLLDVDRRRDSRTRQ